MNSEGIALGSWQSSNSYESYANLIVSDGVGKRVFGAGRVPPNCQLDCESETVAEDEAPFVPLDDSERLFALLFGQQRSNNLFDLLACPSSEHLAWMDRANDLSV